MTCKILGVALIAAPAIMVVAFAQQTQRGALGRTTLLVCDFPPRYETVMVVAEMEPGNHSHVASCSGRRSIQQESDRMSSKRCLSFIGE